MTRVDKPEPPRRILVADDEQNNRFVLRELLLTRGYQVAEAANGREALAQVEALPPDLVLLDVMMPELDGFAVCRRLKGNPQTAHIPVVMVTALHSREDRLEGIEAGADDFLTELLHFQVRARWARIRS